MIGVNDQAWSPMIGGGGSSEMNASYVA